MEKNYLVVFGETYLCEVESLESDGPFGYVIYPIPGTVLYKESPDAYWVKIDEITSFNVPEFRRPTIKEQLMYNASNTV